MFGALVTLGFVVGVIGACRWAFRPYLEHLDPAEQIGLCGLAGLGFVGLDTLAIGLIPGGLHWGIWVEAAAALAGWAALIVEWKAQPIRIKAPGGWRLGLLGGLGLALLVALVGAIGPSDMNDWDSLAYHLAVPKIWIAAGQIVEVPFIHHSNFPFAIDNLFIWGLKWGGAAGAKAFSVAIFGLGMLALFGLVRRRIGEAAGWWAALAFAGIPCVLWESGTAYIDVGHGLFAGLGILYAAEFIEGRQAGAALRAAVLLALGCATKYTGLQTLFAAGAVVLGGAFFLGSRTAGTGTRPPESDAKRASLRALLVFSAAAAVLAGPWYVKTFLWTGNPVYPFFYETIGSRNWDAFSAKIYKEEQQTFGIGSSPDGFGHAVLGLAYQPGRYTNPAQTEGGGMPTGALGACVVAAWLAWLFSGRVRRYEAAILAITAVSLLMWFALSQQSRYLATLGVPAAALAGAAVCRLRAGPFIAGLTALQFAWTLYVGYIFHLKPKLPVLVGKQSAEEYEASTVPFSVAARAINQAVPKDGRVALFDEVFGWYLDVPYFWANPGHSTIIPWDQIENGDQLGAEMKRLGFTHAYLSLAMTPRDQAQRWLEAAGMLDVARPFEPAEREAAFADLRSKWRVLLAEAVASGQLRPLEQFRSGVLFEISR